MMYNLLHPCLEIADREATSRLPHLAALRYRHSINKPVTPEMIDKARLQMNTAHALRHDSKERTGKHGFSRFLKVFR